MCADRGYEVDEAETTVTLAKFIEDCADDTGVVDRNKMAFTLRPSEAMFRRYTPLARPGKPEPVPEIGTIHVQFHSKPNIGIKEIKEFAQLLNEKNYYTGIFVTMANPTSMSMKLIPSLLPTILEIFREEDLLVNISRHELVPKHILLSPEEKHTLLQRYRLRESQLPRIKLDDPMAKYLGLRRSNVVKIIRKSETAGRYASYRWAM